MEFKRSNIGKPRHKMWKKVSKFLIYTLPAYMTIVATMPVDETIKIWVNVAFGLITATINGLSELTVDPATQKTDDTTI